MQNSQFGSVGDGDIAIRCPNALRDGIEVGRFREANQSFGEQLLVVV